MSSLLGALVFLPALVVAAAPGLAHAATGDLIATVNFSQQCASSGLGVGITYDGANLWYSCYANNPDLLRASPTTGQVSASYNLEGGLGSLAYDASRNAIWAASGGPNPGDIYLISLDGSGNVTGSRVAFNTCSVTCVGLVDGLAYDASDDSLYISPDGSATVYHYSTSGQELGSFPWVGTGCYNSGLAVGGDDLFEGSDGCNRIWAVNKTTPATSVFDFSTQVPSDPNFRDESITCDPSTFAGQGVQVVWSKEAYAPMRAHAFAIPSGTCGAGGGTGPGYLASNHLNKNETLGSGNASEHNAECSSGSFPVNCASGNFYHSFTDVQVPGRGIPLDLTRTYNSLAAPTLGPFGYGWTSAYAMGLATNPNTGDVTITQENGAQVAFSPAGSGGYSAPPRVLATLVKNVDGSFTFTRMQRDKFTFSSTGQLLAETDPNGYATTLTYSGGKLATVTDAAGRTMTFGYGSNGLVSSVTDPLGQATSYSYDASDNLTSVSDPMSRTTSFTYDANHLLLTMTDPNGGVVRNTYDSAGRVVAQSDPMSRQTTYSYSGDNFSNAGGTTTITDPHGSVETEHYVDGELTSLTKGTGTPNASTWLYSYAASLGVSSVTDPDGHVSTRTYDSNGNLTSSTDALANTTSYSYNALGEVLTETAPDGIVTSFAYDGAGNLLSKQTSALSSTPSFGPWATAVADTAFSPTAIACPSASLCVAGDAGGDILLSTDPSAANSWSTEGRIVTSTITSVSCAAFPGDTAYHCMAVDSAGQALESDDPAGGAARWSVDSPDSGVPITAVSCPVSDLCAAVDHEGEILTSSDLGWSAPAHIDGYNPMTAISCPSTSLCVATDSVGNVVESTSPFGAGSWQLESGVDGSTDLTAISCPSTTLCVATDTTGNALFSEDPAGAASQWKLEAHVDATRVLTSLSCPSTTLCVAVDGSGNAAISSLPTGGPGAWSVASGVDSSAGFAGVACPSSGLCAAVDKRGNAFSQAPSVSSITVSQTWQLVYGDSGHPGDLTKVTDPVGHVTTYSYDLDGDLVSTTTAPASGVTDTTSAVFDVLGRKVCEVSPNALVTGTSCPSAGSPRVAGTSTWSYDADGELTSMTDPLGHTTSYGHDSDGNVTSATDPTGAVTATVYDADNRPTSVTTGTGATASTTGYGYDLAPGSGACSASVTGAAFCATTTSPLGAVTVSYFDAQDRKVAASQPAAGMSSYRYDAAGNLVGEQAPGGATTNSYDADNRLIGVASSAGGGFASVGTMTFAYDQVGRRLQMTDNTGRTSYQYDVLGRLASVTDGAGASVSYGYDADSNVTSIGYPSGGSVTRGFDGAGELTSVTDFQGATTSFSYDHDGNLVSENLPNGVTSASSFDAADRLAGISDAPTSSPTSPFAGFGYARNSDGQVTSEQDTGMPGNESQSYGYDPQARLASDASGPYSYDLGGDLIGLSSGTSQSFDSAGQLLSATPSGGSATTFGYDSQGNRTTTAVPGSGTTTFSYDQNNELVSANGASYAYNADGLRMSKSVVGQPTQQFTWDVSGGQPLLLSDGTENYVYGPGGLPFEQITAAGPTLVGTTTDETQVTTTQLGGATVGVALPAGAQPGDEVLVGVTEDAGQSASISGCSSVGTWSSGVGAQLQVFARTLTGMETSVNVTFAPTNDSHPVAVVVAAYRGVDPQHPIDTSNGATSTSSTVAAPSLTTTTMQDRLVVFQGALNNPSGASWTPPSGMTQQAQVNQSSLVAAGVADAVVQTTGATGQKTSTFQGTSVSLATADIALRPGALYYLHDQLGSTRALLDTAGSVVASYTYSALGQVVATSGVPGIVGSSRIGFAGAYEDPESGMLYLQHRYYDPETAQFVSSDPLVDITGQPYAYAGGDPVNNSDPLGLSWYNPASWTARDWEVGAGVVLGVAAAATGVGAIVEGATLTGVLLGAGSVTAGLGATALDYGPCVHGNETAACVGLGLGITGVVAGGFGAAGSGLAWAGVIGEYSTTAGILNGIGAFGWNVGIAGTFFDATTGIASASTWQQC